MSNHGLLTIHRLRTKDSLQSNDVALINMYQFEQDEDFVEAPLREGLRNALICLSGAGVLWTIFWFCWDAIRDEKDVSILLNSEYRLAFLIMAGVFALIAVIFIAHAYLGAFVGRRKANLIFKGTIATISLVGLSICAIIVNTRI